MPTYDQDGNPISGARAGMLTRRADEGMTDFESLVRAAGIGLGLPASQVAPNPDGTGNALLTFKPGNSYYEQLARSIPPDANGNITIPSNMLSQALPGFGIGEADDASTIGPLLVAMALSYGTAGGAVGGAESAGGVGAENAVAGSAEASIPTFENAGAWEVPTGVGAENAVVGGPEASIPTGGTTPSAPYDYGNVGTDYDVAYGSGGTAGAPPPTWPGMPNIPPGVQQVLRTLFGGSGGGGGGGRGPGGGGRGPGGGGRGGGGGGGGDDGLLGLLLGLYSMFGNQPDPARSNALWDAGQSVYNLGRDPQNALYDRTSQQVVEGARAGQSARGIAMSPYGAGLENDAMRNFNIDWQNNLLGRSVSGLNAFTGAGQTAMGQSNTDRTFQTNQTGAGTNAALTGIQAGMQPGGWLDALWRTPSASYNYGATGGSPFPEGSL